MRKLGDMTIKQLYEVASEFSKSNINIVPIYNIIRYKESLVKTSSGRKGLTEPARDLVCTVRTPLTKNCSHYSNDLMETDGVDDRRDGSAKYESSSRIYQQ